MPVYTGDAADNVLDHRDSGTDDTLDGGLGADNMLGGDGSDLYIVDNVGDVIQEFWDDFASGNDTVAASVSYELSFGMDNLVLTGFATTNGTGNGLHNAITGNGSNNVLSGLDGNDTLDGGFGFDTLDGGNGIDTADYRFFSGTLAVDLSTGTAAFPGNSVLTETLIGIENVAAGAGNDTLIGSTADNMLEAGAGADALSGADGADTLSGADGDDTLLGQDGNDTLNGGDQDDLLDGGTGADAMDGSGGNDVLTGSSGDDTLDGGTGADAMVGGEGADLYRVDDAGDLVLDTGATGVDTVESTLNTTLASGLENLTLIGVAAVNGTGNAAANTLIGNAAANILNGATGADAMTGNDGNDTYVVDHIGDSISETATSATQIDTVRSTLAHTLGANLENLVLTGTSAINGVGNTLANALTGNAAVNTLTGLAGNDTLDGGGGADSLVGGTGNDTHVVNVAGDKTVETGTSLTEIDLVRAGLSWTLTTNVEQLLLTGTGAFNGTGNTRANLLTGNNAANTLLGLDGRDTLNGAGGNDLLDGGIGSDSLIGGTGVDTFRFSTTLNATTNVDVVSGFVRADDRFLLDDAVFAGIGALGALASGAFRSGTAALERDDRVIYNKAQGKIYFDADGFGGAAQVLFATVAINTDIRADDFFIG